MRHEIHACDGIRLPFDVACHVLDANRHEILEQATRRVMTGEAAEAPRVVTAGLEREGTRSATMAAHWIQPDSTAELEGGLSAWLHCNLRLLPRQAGDHRLTEVLLTASCETSPRDPDAFNDELCSRFLPEVAVGVERKAAVETVPG